MNHTKVGGYGIFLVPANLFDSAQSSILHPFLKKSSEIRAILQLPENLFKNATHAKSVIVLQKQSQDKKMNSEVLLAKVPTMSDRNAMALFIEKIDLWVEEQ